MSSGEFLQPTDTDIAMMRRAIELSRRCPQSRTAFSVGAVLADAAGVVLATGYSREDDPQVHAEERALTKVTGSVPAGATMYSSLEPCSSRGSRPASCASLIIDAGIRRVVFALREPSVFVQGRGGQLLAEAGVSVIETAELADAVREVNGHLLP